MNSADGQLTLLDLDSWCGKMYPELFPAESQKAKTSGLSSKKPSELRYLPYQFLDLTPGAGNLLGESYWETRSPWRGDALTLNTGVSPREEIESSLSRILQETVPGRYYLTKKACRGILRRADERGKELPEKLKRALEIQAGIALPDGKSTELEAYHINQRDEGINLHGVSGALMATGNMQMQTFVTQPNGNEAQKPTAFAANQRDEVRDLHDVAGALCAHPSVKQQTFIAAGFHAGAAPSAGGVGYSEEIAPTLKAAESGTNMVPSIICLNDQGGNVMDCSIDVSGTLRAQEHGHQPLVYENHGIDARYTGPREVVPTMSARYGTGGNNAPLVDQDSVLCIAGNTIDRQPQNGGNGSGYQEDIAYTLTATDHHAVFSRQRVDAFKDDSVAGTQSARQCKDATDLICDAEVFGQSQFANFTPGCSTLRAQGGDHGGGSENLVTESGMDNCRLIRRLTPLECERLQGFPDGWTDVPSASDSARYKALGNSVAIPCVDYVLRGIALALSTRQ